MWGLVLDNLGTIYMLDQEENGIEMVRDGFGARNEGDDFAVFCVM